MTTSLGSSPEMDDYGPHNLPGGSGDPACTTTSTSSALSFENPNYAMADCINSNVPASVLEELSRRHELETAAKKRSSTASSVGSGDSGSARRAYASLDIASMGVDVEGGPVTALSDNRIAEEKREKREKVMHEEDEDDFGEIESDKLVESDKEKGDKSDGEEDESGSSSSLLPAGWERHEDEQGPYYWHIKTGDIQREPPKHKSEDR